MTIRSRFFALAAFALLPLTAACGASPDEVTHDFMNSVQRGDISTAMEMVSSESREAIGDANLRKGLTRGSEMNELEDVDWTVVGEPEISPDGRSAKVKFAVDGDVETMRLVKEDGEWKMDLGGEM